MHLFKFKLQAQNCPSLKIVRVLKFPRLFFFSNLLFSSFVLYQTEQGTCYLKIATLVIFQNNSELSTRNHIRNPFLMRPFFFQDRFIGCKNYSSFTSKQMFKPLMCFQLFKRLNQHSVLFLHFFSLWLELPPRTQFLATRQGRRLAASSSINANVALQPARNWTWVFLWSLKSSGHNTNISQRIDQSYLTLLLGIVHFKTISLF